MGLVVNGVVAQASLVLECQPIGIVLLSDVRFVREALVTFLQRHDKIRIVGAFDEFGTEFEQSLTSQPDIVLIDTALIGGTAAVRRTKQVAPEVRVVAFALAESENDVIAWAESGVSGYIPRSAALDDVVPLLECTMRGEQPCSPTVASGLVRRIAIGAHAVPDHKSLTRREIQIVGLISKGLSNKEIANTLEIGLTTAKSHVHNVLGKLGLVRRSQAAQWMREQVVWSDTKRR
jgi:two-component system nitrate/nitrite response regulator NarL